MKASSVGILVQYFFDMGGSVWTKPKISQPFVNTGHFLRDSGHELLLSFFCCLRRKKE